MTLRLGIDVGGTHTDAVLVDEHSHLLGAVKTPTTHDVTTGIVASLDLVLQQSGVNPAEIKYAMIGTTHCINAILERRRLARVALFRLALPAGQAVEPMADWPLDLREGVGNLAFQIRGGFEYDGRPLAELDTGQVRAAARVAHDRQVQSVAISSIFSPVRTDHEAQAADLVRAVLGEHIPISLSSEIGSIGLIERENATILNASVVEVARAAAAAFEQACTERDIHARIYFSQNDGTLMSVEYARRYPILTVSSGPTNSIRGAGHLTGLADGIVVDIGGTTTLVGALVKGFPRQSAAAIKIGGVRTNFRMPDLISIGCGGGTIVRPQNGSVRLGPDSVGYELPRRARAWGGDTLTTTDVALAAGYAEISDGRCDPARLRNVPAALVQAAVGEIVALFEESVDKIKTSREPVPLVLVGGGGILIPRDRYDRLKGVSHVIRPEHFQYANALGAAVAQVSGQIERIFPMEHTTRSAVMDEAKALAKQEAVRAGADPGSVEIVDIDEVFLSYLPSNAARIRVKAAGTLAA